MAGRSVRERSVAGRSVRDRVGPGRSAVRSAVRPRDGGPFLSRSMFRSASLSQDRRAVLEDARRSSPALPALGRVRGRRSERVLSPAEPSSVRRGAARWKARVPGPVLPVPVLPVPVLRVPAPDDRPAAGRAPSRAGGRAARRAPPAAGGRAVRRVLPVLVGRDPSAAGGREVRRVPSDAGGRAARRAPSAAGVRGLRRARSPVAPSRATPPRPVRGSCPVRPTAVWPRPSLAEPLVPVGRGPLRGVFDVPAATRALFGTPRPPPVRPPFAPRPLGVPCPSATPTNLQLCHHRTQTNEEGRSTSSGATLFTYVRQRPTLPRGPPRSTIGAEGLNFRVRNGTGCFPFAITAETLLRCHRPSGPDGDRISGTAQWTRNNNME